MTCMHGHDLNKMAFCLVDFVMWPNLTHELGLLGLDYILFTAQYQANLLLLSPRKGSRTDKTLTHPLLYKCPTWNCAAIHTSSPFCSLSVCKRNGKENHSICEENRRRKWKDVKEFGISGDRWMDGITWVGKGTWALNWILLWSSGHLEMTPARFNWTHPTPTSFYAPTQIEKGIWRKFISISRQC